MAEHDENDVHSNIRVSCVFVHVYLCVCIYHRNSAISTNIHDTRRGHKPSITSSPGSPLVNKHMSTTDTLK